MPSKAELLEHARLLESGPDSRVGTWHEYTIKKTARMLRAVAEEQEEPVAPKVKTLREAVERLGEDRRGTDAYDDQAGGLAIVLRRVDRLEEILDDATDRKTQLSRDLAEEREINRQMLEGSVE